jgi:hypothetical protein
MNRNFNPKNNLMKSFLTLLLGVMLLINTNVFSQNVGINSTGATPNLSAMLDIVSTSQGLLVPRVTLQSNVDNGTTITNGNVTSLLVYNTTAASAGATAVFPGYYYWNGAKWVAFTGNGGNNWALLGNTGITNPAVPGTYGTSTFGATENWLGTTDANDVTFGTNNIERMRIKQTTGNVGIGTAAPGQAFDVYGKFQVNSSGNAVKINNVSYNWPAAQGAANSYLKNDGAGNLSWVQLYGGNVQSVNATSSIQTSSATFADMTGMTITFTPVHSTVFLHFTAAGATDNSGTAGYVECQAVNVTSGNTVLGGCVSLSDETDITSGGHGSLNDNGQDAAWNCAMILPVTVTPGTSTTLKIQWSRGGTNPSTAICAPAANPNYSHRTMVIWD